MDETMENTTAAYVQQGSADDPQKAADELAAERSAKEAAEREKNALELKMSDFEKNQHFL